MLRQLGASVFLVVTLACGGGTSTSPTGTTSQTFSLTGVVRSGSAPVVAGATVSVDDGPNAGKATVTDGSGHYTLSALQAGTFTVTASAGINYTSQSQRVAFTSNQIANFVLQLRTSAIVLMGQVVDAATLAPIAGAIVSINGRYRGITDGSGRYSVSGFLDGGAFNFTYVSADNYASDYRYIQGTSQNVHLHRVERITAGATTVITVTPGDTLCVNNVSDSPPWDNICRSIRVVAPVNGMLTVEAVSTQTAAHPLLEVETVGVTPCCSERMGNPTTIQVAAGVEVVVNVEMRAESVAAESFKLTTSISPHN